MIALRTQQVIAEESGVANVVDPFGGSYFMETLTNRGRARGAGLHPPHRRDGRHGQGDRARISRRPRSPTAPIISSVSSRPKKRSWSASISTKPKKKSARSTLSTYYWSVKGRGPVPEGRQGPGGRGRRGPGDEADARSRRAARARRAPRACSARRCARSSSWPTPAGVDAVVDQQFEVGRQILAAGLVPIIEPEVDIHSPEKAAAEALLKAAIVGQLGAARPGPARDAQAHAARRRTASTPTSSPIRTSCASVALSGGYARDDANDRAGAQPRASSPASPGRSPRGSPPSRPTQEFDAALDTSIKAIYEASIT